MKNLILILCLATSLISCSKFKAKRVDSTESDEKALEITDEWVNADTEKAVKAIVAQMQKHKRFKRYLRKLGRAPNVFTSEVQNGTSEPYFPIDDMNDELLYSMDQSGDFVLVDAAARELILKEVTYQNNGMVDPQTAKEIGKQTGADLLIFGKVYMKPKTRKGKTIKEYSVNIRMTDLEKGVEVLRTRTKLFKYSDKSSFGW
jgi:uncharacterized protein (TIGR02722 family)